MKRIIRAIALTLVLSLATVLSPSVAFSAGNGATDADRADVFYLTNQLRVSEGKATLTRSAHLDGVAQKWAETMSPSNFKHNPNLATDVCVTNNYCYTFLAENVAYNSGSTANGAEIYDQWLNSPGHRNNMVDARAARIGIGLSRNNGVLFGVQVFATYRNGYNPEPAVPVTPVEKVDLTWILRTEHIDVGAAYSGGTASTNLEYQFLQYHPASGVWGVISDWTTGNWVSWKTTPDTYWLHVQVRNKTTKTVLVSKTIAFAYSAGMSEITYFGYQETASGLVLQAHTNNSAAKLTTSIYDAGAGKWTNTFVHTAAAPYANWTPEAGNYWLYTQLVSKDGRVLDSSVRTIGISNNSPWLSPENRLGLTWILREEHLDVGIAYTSNNPSNLEYSFKQYDVATGQWASIADWGSGNWASWKTDAGTYWLHVQVRNKTTKAILGTKTIAFAYSAGYLKFNNVAVQQYGKNVQLTVASNSTNNAKTVASIYDINAGQWIQSFTFTRNQTQQTWLAPTPGPYLVNYELRTTDGRLAATKAVGTVVN